MASMKETHPIEYAILCELVGREGVDFSHMYPVNTLGWGDKIASRKHKGRNCAFAFGVNLANEDWGWFECNQRYTEWQPTSWLGIVEHLRDPEFRKKHNLPPVPDEQDDPV